MNPPAALPPAADSGSETPLVRFFQNRTGFWNWKAALFSTLLRGGIFFGVNATAGLKAGLASLGTELLFRPLMAGYCGTFTQSCRRVQPEWKANVAVMVVIPACNHGVEFFIHWLNQTPRLKTSLVVSLGFSVISALFSLFAMRRGVFLVGGENQSLLEDVRRIPGILAAFLWVLPAWLLARLSVFHQVRFWVVIGVCLGWSLLVVASSGGPLASRTGAPGEMTCAECHGNGVNQGPGRIEILGLPERYAPGATFPVTVRVGHPNRNRWGFQITAIDESGRSAGTFIPADEVNYQILANSVDGQPRSYLEHTEAGTQAGQLDTAQFHFKWIAPLAETGPVTFHTAGVAANGNSSNSGDSVYQASFRLAGVSTAPAPILEKLEPNHGPTTGGQLVSLQGNHFAVGATILFGHLPGRVQSVSATGIQVLTPPQANGPVAVSVRNPDGQTTASSFPYTYRDDFPLPQIRLLVPNGGEVFSAGGRSAEIRWEGKNLGSGFLTIRLSTDGGQTFPLVLVPQVPGTTTSFRVVIPPLPVSSQARLQLRWEGVGLTAVDASDSDFSLVKAPVIDRVEQPAANKVKIRGSGFQPGALVEANGLAVKTKAKSQNLLVGNLSTPIGPGLVTFLVRNPDGGVSKDFNLVFPR